MEELTAGQAVVHERFGAGHVEFSKGAVQQMCNEYPGAALALIDAYRLAITEGRSATQAQP